MFKTLSTSMIAAYAAASQIDNALVESLNLQDIPKIDAVLEFTHGFIVEFCHINNLVQTDDCVDSFHHDFHIIEEAIDDLKKGDTKDAITQITAWVASLKPDIQKCTSAEQEWLDVEHYFGQYAKDHTKLEKKVAEALALHHKELKEDEEKIRNDIKDKDFKQSGYDAADLLALVLGPVEPTYEGIPKIDAVLEFTHGFIVEFCNINNLVQTDDCVDSFHHDFHIIEEAIDDLKKGDTKDAITQITAWVASLKPDIQKCASAEQEWLDVEHYFGQYAKDHTKLEKKVAEALALHHKELKDDEEKIRNDIKDKDFKQSGYDAADLLALVLGPVEPKLEDPPRPQLDDAILFAKGFLVEFTKINKLTNSGACVKNFITDFSGLETAYDDLKNGDYKSAITALTDWVATIVPDVQKCSSALPELKEVEEFFGQYVKDHSKLIAKVTAALADADERKIVLADVSAMEADIKSGDLETCGSTAADLVNVVLGPVTPAAVFLQ